MKTLREKLNEVNAQIEEMEGNIITCTFPFRKAEMEQELEWLRMDAQDLDEQIRTEEFYDDEEAIEQAEANDALADSWEPSTYHPRF